MLVRDIMSATAHSLRAGTSFEEAIALLATARISSVPIVDEDRAVVGILTEADVLRSGLEPDARATLRPPAAVDTSWPALVDEAMTADPVTVRPTSDVADVARLMGERGWKSLPVTDSGRLVAMISRSDILASLHTSDGEIRERLAGELATLGHPDWVVVVTFGAVSVDGPADDREEHLARSAAAATPGVRRVRLSGDPRQ